MIRVLLRERGLTVLAMVLVVQAAILVLTRLPGREEAPELLLAGLTAEAATRIEIDDGADGRIVMVREEDGWVLSEADGYPADGARIDDLLIRLLTARRERPVVRTEAGRRELRVVVEEYERRVRIRAGVEGYLLYIGNTSGTRGAHVRVEGDDEVWSVDGLAAWQVSVDQSAWVDQVYLRVEPDMVTSFELVNVAGSFRFQRTGEEWESPDLGFGEAVDQERLGTFVNRVSTLRMRRPLGTEPPDEYGLAARAAVIRLDLSSDEDGEAGTLELIILAGEGDGDDYIVKSSDSEYYVAVSSFALADLVDADRSTFVTADVTGSSSSGDLSQ